MQEKKGEGTVVVTTHMYFQQLVEHHLCIRHKQNECVDEDEQRPLLWRADSGGVHIQWRPLHDYIHACLHVCMSLIA